MGSVLQEVFASWDMNPSSVGGAVTTTGTANINGTTAGSTVIVAFGCISGVDTTTSHVNSVTDDQGNTYTLVPGTNHDLLLKFPACAFYEANNVAAHATLVSINATETDNSTIPAVIGFIGVIEIAVANAPTITGGSNQNLSQEATLDVVINDSFGNPITTTSQTGFVSGVFNSKFSMVVCDVVDTQGNDVWICFNIVDGGAFMVPPMGTLPTITAPWSYALIGKLPPLPGNSADAAFFGPGSNPLTAICNNPPAAIVGVPYSHFFQATGGQSPYTWALTSGAFPGGLSMDSSGHVTGTPTTSGQFSVTVTVTDAVAATAPVTCSISSSKKILGGQGGGGLCGPCIPNTAATVPGPKRSGLTGLGSRYRGLMRHMGASGGSRVMMAGSGATVTASRGMRGVGMGNLGMVLDAPRTSSLSGLGDVPPELLNQFVDIDHTIPFSYILEAGQTLNALEQPINLDGDFWLCAMSASAVQLESPEIVQKATQVGIRIADGVGYKLMNDLIFIDFFTPIAGNSYPFIINPSHLFRAGTHISIDLQEMSNVTSIVQICFKGRYRFRVSDVDAQRKLLAWT